MNLLSSEFHRFRSKYLTTIRRFLEENGFLEMDTPIFKTTPGMEPYLDPFLVCSPSGEERGYLITSPEYSLKMLLSSGLEKIYEITHTFRSGEKGSGVHTAEFLMLELYAAQWDEFQLMDWMEEFFSYLDQNLYQFGFQNLPVSRVSNLELFLESTGRGWDRESLEKTLQENKIPYSSNASYEDLYYLVFLNLVEPKLSPGILFLYDYPPECCALAKIENGVARRFEIYWDRLELANAFYELVDPVEQRKRLESERELRRTMGKEAFALDENFLRCLEMGMPEGSGISLGLDRLLMKILGKQSLREVSPYSR